VSRVYRAVCFLVLFLPVIPVPAATSFTAGPTAEADCVVLLHGLARSAASMKKIQRELCDRHYAVLNIDYPSTRFPIEVLVNNHVKPVIDRSCPRQSNAIHFVTHSMGGILVRYYLKRYKPPKLGRVVMISPPNQGSELVDVLGDFFLFEWLNGPAGGQLGTSADSLPNRLGSANYDLAVITGNRSYNPFYSYLIPGVDDGKVAVDRARLNGMREFKIVPKAHTFIVRNPTVIKLVADYIASGSFDGDTQTRRGNL
jgi:pimeloyl-ACP methyl ester carboxylesterase